MSIHHRIIPGRASCLQCRELHDANGLNQHYRFRHQNYWRNVHIERRMQRRRTDKVGIDGRLRCRTAHTKLKVIYDTLDAAWAAAWEVFVQKGHSLTPYQCQPYRFEYVVTGGQVRCIAHAGCNRWHLARTEHALILTGGMA